MKADRKAVGREVADYADRMSAVVRRLAEAGVQVESIYISGGALGYWEMLACKRREAIKIFWDGRDKVITVDVSPIHPPSYPNDWRRIENKKLNLEAGEDPLVFSEALLRKYFSRSSFKSRTNRCC